MPKQSAEDPPGWEGERKRAGLRRGRVIKETEYRLGLFPKKTQRPAAVINLSNPGAWDKLVRSNLEFVRRCARLAYKQANPPIPAGSPRWWKSPAGTWVSEKPRSQHNSAGISEGPFPEYSLPRLFGHPPGSIEFTAGVVLERAFDLECTLGQAEKLAACTTTTTSAKQFRELGIDLLTAAYESAALALVLSEAFEALRQYGPSPYHPAGKSPVEIVKSAAHQAIESAKKRAPWKTFYLEKLVEHCESFKTTKRRLTLGALVKALKRWDKQRLARLNRPATDADKLLPSTDRSIERGLMAMHRSGVITVPGYSPS